MNRAITLTGMKLDPSTWAGALALYRSALTAAGRSPRTIGLHMHYLGQLARVHRDPWQISTADLQAVMSGRGWSPETLKSARSTYRSFFRWGFGAGHAAHDPAACLAPVRVPPAVARPTPEHVVRQLLRDPDPRIGFMGMLAALAGLRVGEIAQVHRRDFEGDHRAGVLLVHGKGGRLREVPVLDDRLAGRLASVPEGCWAFPNGLGGHLTPGHVSRLLSRALPVGWTAHQLRHRFGTVAYAATRDLLAVGALLGHSRPETTQRYVQLPADALAAAVRAAGHVA